MHRGCLPADIFPCDVAIRVRMADELALRSPVALTERMKRVQFPEIIRGAIAELGGAKSREVLFARS
jgi:hypothetical protein